MAGPRCAPFAKVKRREADILDVRKGPGSDSCPIRKLADVRAQRPSSSSWVTLPCFVRIRSEQLNVANPERLRQLI